MTRGLRWRIVTVCRESRRTEIVAVVSAVRRVVRLRGDIIMCGE